MSSEFIANWITAIATAVTAFAVFFVERSRRRYERKQAHFKKIKEFVIHFLDDILGGHYLPILECRDGILRFDTVPIFSEETSSSKDSFQGWKPALAIKSARAPIGASVGEHETWQKHQETYPYLYPDAKVNHFPELFGKWESFENGFEELGRKSASLAEQMAKKLEERIKILPWSGSNTSESWVNYFSLSIFIYRRLWGAQTGTLNIYEQSGNWVLQEWSETYGRGTKEQMGQCRLIVDEFLASERTSIQPLKEQARHLLPEANTIQQELQQLLLKTDLPGRCKFI